MIKIGIDVHGVADAYPAFFSMFTKLLVESGHEVHILTGAEHTPELERHIREDLGLTWTHFYSITSYHKKMGTQVTYIDGNPYMDNKIWNRAKSQYCKQHGIHLHIDDSDIYEKHFESPYARFSCKSPPCSQIEEEETPADKLHAEQMANTDCRVKPVLAIKQAVCALKEGTLKVLLVKPGTGNGEEPWKVPEGILDETSPLSLEETARDIVHTHTGLDSVYMEQLKTYGNTKNSEGRTLISTAYFTLIPVEKLESAPHVTSHSIREKWISLGDITSGKHPEIPISNRDRTLLKDFKERLMGKISYAPIAFELLPDHFTWPELRMVYETILDKELDATNFKKKIKSIHTIRELETTKLNCCAGRPARYLEYVGVKEIYT